MTNKRISIFRISRGYVGCRVYHGDKRSHVRVGTSTLTLDKGVPRKQRYNEIAKFLVTMKLHVPPYQPTKAEANHA